jgi:tetratricopeptide (TPR) repeat protein
MDCFRSRRFSCGLFWLLCGGLVLLLAGCDKTDEQWQQQTIQRIQAVPTNGWDDFSARRLPKLLHTLQKSPDKARQAWLQLALLLQTHDATELATGIFQYLDAQAAHRDKLKPAYRYFLASGLAESGQLDQALEALHGQLDNLNDLDKIAFRLTEARWLMENGRADQARGALQAVEKISPHYPELLYRQATLALQSGDCQQAIDKLRLMLEYKPGLTQLYRPLASAYRLCNQPDKAAEALARQGPGKLAFENRFTKMAEQIGNPVKYLRGLVRQASAAEQLPAALKFNSQLLKLMPKDPTNWLNQGSILYRLRRYEQAARVYRKGLALDADNPELLTNLGNALWQQGQVEKAAKHYRLAIQADPRQLQARLNLAGLRLQQGRAGESEALYRQLLAIEPANVLAQAGLMQSLLAQAKGKEAMQQLHQWWQQSPSDPVLMRLLLQTALQTEISPQQAGAQWLRAIFAEAKEASGWLSGTSSVPELIDLAALWRYKTGVVADADSALSWWQQSLAAANSAPTNERRQRMQAALQQVQAGQTPDWVNFSVKE